MNTETVEERLTVVEHKVEENARRIDGLHEAIRDLGNRMERRFEAIDRRFDAIDRRFEAIDRRFETIDRRFLWLVGFQMTTLIAVIGAIAAAALGSWPRRTASFAPQRLPRAGLSTGAGPAPGRP